MRSSQILFHCESAVNTESSDIESTSIASVVFPVINIGHLLGRIESVCAARVKHCDTAGAMYVRAPLDRPSGCSIDSPVRRRPREPAGRPCALRPGSPVDPCSAGPL